MLIKKVEKHAVIGTTIELSHQEQIIIKDVVNGIKQDIEIHENSSRKIPVDEVCVNKYNLNLLIKLLDEMSGNDVMSMEDCFNQLFDIKPEKEEEGYALAE